jgi:hypothetical protein
MALREEIPMLEILKVAGGLRFSLGDYAISDIPLPSYIAEEVLAGGTAQLCGRDRYCRIEGMGNVVKMTYADGGDAHTCYARFEDFAHAVRELD